MSLTKKIRYTYIFVKVSSFFSFPFPFKYRIVLIINYAILLRTAYYVPTYIFLFYFYHGTKFTYDFCDYEFTQNNHQKKIYKIYSKNE